MADSPEIESSNSANSGRIPDIKICQTDALVLISILEPGLTDSEIDVLIEPQNISVELARQGIKNPVISGVLFGTVEKEHCRVRIKRESVLVKLRKTEKGRWKSILQEAITDQSAVAAPEARVPPEPGCNGPSTMYRPFEPRDTRVYAAMIPPPVVSKSNSGKKVAFDDQVKGVMDDQVMGVMDNIRQFQSRMFFNSSFDEPEEDEPSESSDESSPMEAGIEVPLIDEGVRSGDTYSSDSNESPAEDNIEESSEDEEIMETYDELSDRMQGLFVKRAESLLGHTGSDISGYQSPISCYGVIASE